MTKHTKTFGPSPVIPVDERSVTSHMVHFVSYASNPILAGLQPLEYTGWRDESLSWHDSSYIHANLNPSPTYRFWGPDSIEFLKKYCGNSFEKFPVGFAKHGIMLDEQGRIMVDGLLVRREEDYITYWMNPWLQYCVENSDLDVQGEDVTGKVFMFQLGGPTCLQVLDAASGENLHDIKFIHHRMSKIAGRDVMILRVGMAGSLAYEVHGNVEDAIPVYEQILKAGVKYGLKRLGTPAYNMTHWENGFPQAYLDFPLPWFEHKEFAAWLREREIGFLCDPEIVKDSLSGSVGQDFAARYRNPIELGWGKTINMDHEFVGKKAIEELKAKSSRQMVTLEWNKEDILDIHRSQLADPVPYKDISSPEDLAFGGIYPADWVLNDKGEQVGVSSGRMVSWFYREMISLCSIDEEYLSEGTEVWVLWGEPGTRQKKVRAKVARYPYFNECRNQKVDTSLIPVGTMD
ncbi:aminomethyltransferase [Pseudomonas taiwanensis]|uniref:aminomethyl transferase family protein n=1 Tax=Pseudomonas TaxID=286 RepID=UPI0015C00B3F|nr:MULTISPECIES: aminomethyl transferase family protein [Pseudomonas]MDH4564418.1 aminomethyl transferase family protein [Pseudomonas sp. BN411]MDH4656732.1 aminomethyl transferase family protein [Pseudomonas sp. BN606]MDH4874062.1 aminomethyl transferase family protein [Pseudomonas sp. BN515]NWL75694.1 aminomethyltransferase [Pseudomonas taiwanensis]